jgi:hypothetical protein
MPKLQIEPGKWYFVVECVDCHEEIGFREAPSIDEEPEVQCGPVFVECPYCYMERTYQPSEIRRVQAIERD